MELLNILLSFLQDQTTIIIGFLLGGIFAWIDLARKYPTTQKYLYRMTSAYLYTFISAAGASGITYAMQALGVKFTNVATLNNGILSLLGAGLFIGIISTIALPASSQTDEFGPQLKTLRDFVFDYLNVSINRELTQRLEKEIKKLHRNIFDKDRFYDEAEIMLGGIKEIPEEERKQLSAKFLMASNEGKYALVIRELAKYRDIDFIIQQLSDEKIFQDISFDEANPNQQTGNLLKQIWHTITRFSREEQRITQTLYYDVYGLVYNCFGEYAQKDGKQELAQKYYLKAIALAQKIDHKSQQAVYSGNLGKLVLERKEWGEASKWFFEELALANETNNLSLLAQAKGGLARVFQAEQRAEQAQQWANEALEIYRRLNDHEQAQMMEFLVKETEVVRVEAAASDQAKA